MRNPRRNRIAVQLEDEIYEATIVLAEREGVSASNLVRSIIITELAKRELLPEATLMRLVGVRSG